jgi:hypothetical protein
MAFKKEESEEINDTWSFAGIVERMVELQANKQSGYSTNPIDELPLDVWLAQIQIKATRAKYAMNEAKCIDELIDTAVYSILAVSKIAKENNNDMPVL